MEKKIEELEEKIKKLEEEIIGYKNREQEMEFLIEQYNSLVKDEFDSFDEFVMNLVTRKIIDENTRVYSKEFFEKLFSIYYQKAFEMDKECGIITIRLPYFDKVSGEEKKVVEREIGKILRESVRIPLDIIARYSNVSFVILLTDITKDVFDTISERIKKRLTTLTDYSNNFKMKRYYIPVDDVKTEDILNDLR
ncbi:hypothetical protein OSSY52_00580 [Tepiditoga spiralis]|uniref:GGDEF domain-containing protein n=1 Tax=Tepiditoga spiralis TaxID=2108365 RepID=A0A7G1G4W1_9BACT|nr:diguanylate cyclase [Tepiditoga spiralis]BBE29917.1 hypothetical protein OSSY52_00580 [Tepiditoga spiralis]